MTRRTKRLTIIGGIIVVLLIIAALLYWFFFRTPEPIPEPLPPQVEEQEPAPEVDDQPTITQQRQQAEQQERNNTSSIQSLSKTFVQRYGSYSNESDFANLEDVMPLMTDAFATETTQFIEDNEAPEDYYGVTTRVVSLSVESLDEAGGTATLRITTQREEAIGSPQNTSVRYQDIVLQLEQEDDSWLVDDANWQ